jgi:methylenetetrahydrofolate reductase (NADPH)
MPKKKLSEALTLDSNFVVVAELAAGPGYNFNPIKKFLTEANETGTDVIPKGFDFIGITLPQNPGGISNIEPMDVLSRISDLNLLGDLDFIPHVSCKDHNVDAIKSSLINYRERKVQSVLALTGDKPVSAKGIFEVESVGLLQLIERMNCESYLKAKPDQWNSVIQFFPGAAVSPFKYTEGSQMQQYYKMEKKIISGAKFLITQVGWDWKKSLELMLYLKENSIEIPVLGNVYLLSTITPAPRLMHDGKLPGCFVSDEFLKKLQSEQFGQHIERAAQQVAMYKSIGASGVDIGGLPDFDTFMKILSLANQIGSDWEKYKDNLCWPGGENFYLYEGNGKEAVTLKKKKSFRQKSFDFMHRMVLDPDHSGFKLFRGAMNLLGTKKRKGFCYKSFYASERAFKYLAFDCQDCGDCYLPENFSYCTIGGCEKGLSNAPCGDSTVEGLCGNNLERICIGDLIYKAAAAKENGRAQLKTIINQPRMHALENTSSILNYLFGIDHTNTAALISISEVLDASNPAMGTIMKQYIETLDQPGKPQSEKAVQNAAFNYLKAQIQTQAEEGAAYISVNIDALVQNNPEKSAELIQKYVKLIRQLSKGVPVCIDSQYEEALIAGLKEWYNTTKEVKPPLVGPVKLSFDKLLSLKKTYDFRMVSILSNGSLSHEQTQSSIQESLNLARKYLDKAIKEYQFKPDNVYLDPIATSLTANISDTAGSQGKTYNTFRIIKEIRHTPAFKKSHCLIRLNQATEGIKNRKVGVNRAYVAKAMECGLDAAFVDVTRHYGENPADPELIKVIDAFTQMDGSDQNENDVRDLIGTFIEDKKKVPVKT